MTATDQGSARVGDLVITSFTDYTDPSLPRVLRIDRADATIMVAGDVLDTANDPAVTVEPGGRLRIDGVNGSVTYDLGEYLPLEAAYVATLIEDTRERTAQA